MNEIRPSRSDWLLLWCFERPLAVDIWYLVPYGAVDGREADVVAVKPVAVRPNVLSCLWR